jgi:hypothetical protein
VDLARLVKRKGHRLMAALAPHHLTVSMYQTWSEARFGFRKNLYILLGGSPIVALIVAATAVLALMAPILAWSGAWSQSSQWGLSWPLDWRWEWSRATRLLVASSLYCGLGMLQMRLFRTPRAVVIRMPIATLLALWILLESWWAMSRKNVTWKGRLLPD